MGVKPKTLIARAGATDEDEHEDEEVTGQSFWMGFAFAASTYYEVG